MPSTTHRPPRAASTAQVPSTTYARILETFAEMVGSRGYAESNLRDLAQELGISKGTILHHFGSKLRLFERVMVDYMDRRQADLDAIFNSDDSAEQVRRLIVAVIASLRADPATLAFTREVIRVETSDLEAVRERRQRYREGVVRLLDRGVERGELREGDTQLACNQILGMCCWAWTWFPQEADLDADTVGNDFADRLLGGFQA
jgi:TetR/AcrR family transcriptional regulator, cholesterol catabolism regulator